MARRVVLVADADPATARKIRRALQGYTLGVVGVRNLAGAIDCSSGNDVAVVISALALPDGSGYDLGLRFQSARPPVPVFLLCGGFDVLDPSRALAAGVTAGIRRPLSADSLLGHLEMALGPLPVDVRAEADDPAGGGPWADDHRPPWSEEAEDLPGSHIETLDPPMSPASLPPELPVPPPPTGPERLATFIPHDYESLPTVAVDPEVVGAAMERAIMAVLPEVMEVILDRALRRSDPLRALVRDTVARQVREQMPTIARGVVRDFLAEQGTDPLRPS